jgi:cyclopropane fatty-acyl-phospholipid synthase-like methyltransferase
MSDELFAEYFLNAIDSRNAYLALAIADQLDLGRSRLLDVGGGSGIYACALAQRNPELRAAVLEKPPVDAVARRAVQRRGLAERVTVLPGDMLEAPLPRGYDVHLLSNVVHDFEEPTIARLLRSSYEALDGDGLIVIHDPALADGSQRAVAHKTVLMMALPAGRCYSVDEMSELVSAACFSDVRYRRTVVHRGLVTAVKARR